MILLEFSKVVEMENFFHKQQAKPFKKKLLIPTLKSVNCILNYSPTSNNTPKTLSQSCSPVSSLIAGGAKRASLIPIRNNKRLSQVSLSKVVELRATCCKVLKTR